MSQEIKGHLKNLNNYWVHKFKKAVAPGGEIPLSELYTQFSKSKKLKNKDDLLKWLRSDEVLKGDPGWKIVEDPRDLGKVTVPVPRDLDNISKSDYTVEDIVLLSVAKARNILPTVSDIKLLKLALKEATPRAGKDSLCRLLVKRIEELAISGIV